VKRVLIMLFAEKGLKLLYHSVFFIFLSSFGLWFPFLSAPCPHGSTSSWNLARDCAFSTQLAPWLKMSQFGNRGPESSKGKLFFPPKGNPGEEPELEGVPPSRVVWVIILFSKTPILIF
jgi:hypothetical protein